MSITNRSLSSSLIPVTAGLCSLRRSAAASSPRSSLLRELWCSLRSLLFSLDLERSRWLLCLDEWCFDLSSPRESRLRRSEDRSTAGDGTGGALKLANFGTGCFSCAEPSEVIEQEILTQSHAPESQLDPCSVVGRGDEVGAWLEKLRSGPDKKKKKSCSELLSKLERRQERLRLLALLQRVSPRDYRLVFAKGWARCDLV